MKRGSKRRMGRKGRASKQRLVNLQALTPIAQRYITKHKYVETVALNLANNYTYAYNLNSLFDPNRTGIGHQPYGYDTFALLYNRYRVINCSYTVQAYPGNGTSPVTVAVHPANELITFPDTDTAMENPKTKWAVQLPGGNTRIIKGNVYIPSLVGRPRTQYMADDRYQAQVGTSPAELAVLNIVGNNFNGVDENINIVVTLNYTVEWFDFIRLPQS